MKSRGLFGVALALMIAAAWGFFAFGTTQAKPQAADPSVTRGAMLYDNWINTLKAQAPAGNMPIWAKQTTNSLSGADTWRCVTCHGWDYQGKDGAYRSGSYSTGFPGVYTAAQKLKAEEIVAVLKGKNDPDHNFSSYLDDASLNDLAAFLKTALVDDAQYIDPVALTVKGGDLAQGKQLFSGQCAKCHGEDGTEKLISFQGRNTGLGTIANVDPWRFLHKTRFGTPGTDMVLGYDLKWTPEQGRDVLLYARTLPNELKAATPPPTIGESPVVPASPAGQSQSFFVGLITAAGAVFTGLGFAVILGAFLVGVIFIVVWQMRERRK
jgi:mono/diheme cytochrome c family protein